MWLIFISVIPVLPRIKVLELAGQPLLLDELVLACSLVAVLVGRIGAPAVTGYARLAVTRVGLLFSVLILWKATVLFVSAVFVHWVPQGGHQFLLGQGIHFREGILVIGKSVALAVIFAWAGAEFPWPRRSAVHTSYPACAKEATSGVPAGW